MTALPKARGTLVDRIAADLADPELGCVTFRPPAGADGRELATTAAARAGVDVVVFEWHGVTYAYVPGGDGG